MFLFRDRESLSVSPQGGTVARWQYGSTHVLHPREVVDEAGEVRFRGGLHGCFPNFGPAPGDYSRLPQHGFLRDSSSCGWHMLARAPEAARFWFGATQQTLSMFPWEFWLEVEVELLEEGGFRHTCRLRNTDRSNRSPMPVGLGLHPYFRRLGGEVTIGLGDETIILSPGPLDFQVHKSARDAAMVIPGLGTVWMSLFGAYAEGMVGLWSGGPAYFCVEPICGDPSFFGGPSGKYLGFQEQLFAEAYFRFYPE